VLERIVEETIPAEDGVKILPAEARVDLVGKENQSLVLHEKQLVLDLAVGKGKRGQSYKINIEGKAKGVSPIKSTLRKGKRGQSYKINIEVCGERDEKSGWRGNRDWSLRGRFIM
jgi:hypothetical protein